MDSNFVRKGDSKPVYNFYDCDERQKYYRELFVQWLRDRPNVKDVRKGTREEDLAGIDFHVTDTKGKEHTLQLKVDFIADGSGNLPIETISQAYSTRNSVIGAEFNMERVELIFYVLVPSLRVIGFRFKHFLEYAIENYPDFRNFRAYNNTNGVFYRTLGALIPIRRILSLAITRSRLSEPEEGDQEI